MDADVSSLPYVSLVNITGVSTPKGKPTDVPYYFSRNDFPSFANTGATIAMWYLHSDEVSPDARA